MNNRTRTLVGIGATAAALGTAGLPAVASAAATKRYSATSTSQWGPVKVTVTVKGKKISAIAISADPHTQRSYQLQSFALPTLRSEALKAQSYRIHTVSGATYTSDSFIISLHADMKHAHLA